MRPLLAASMQLASEPKVAYRYDETRQLSVTQDGVPVAASAVLGEEVTITEAGRENPDTGNVRWIEDAETRATRDPVSAAASFEEETMTKATRDPGDALSSIAYPPGDSALGVVAF